MPDGARLGGNRDGSRLLEDDGEGPLAGPVGDLALGIGAEGDRFRAPGENRIA